MEREYAAALELLSAGAAGADDRAALGAVGAAGEAYGALRRTRMVKQGDNALSFYEGEGRGSAGWQTGLAGKIGVKAPVGARSAKRRQECRRGKHECWKAPSRRKD